MPYWFRPQKNKVRFAESAKAINTFKEHVQDIACPACTQKTLQVDKLEVGPKAWTADISCTNCEFSGFVNTHGFAFAGVSKVRARPAPKAASEPKRNEKKKGNT